jgi:hypothetical protein
LLVGAEGLKAHSLRIAPGGVVRVIDGASLELTEALLVCPGATLQAGADPVRKRPTDERALDGRRLALSARVAVVLGTIESRGASLLFDDDGRGGNGGAIDIEVERFLHAGVIDASSSAPSNRGELGGEIHILASKESFVSGTVKATSGRVVIEVPVL